MASYRIYRANSKKNGSASEFQLSFKPNKKYDAYQLFLTMAPQLPNDDDNGNASFDWKGSSTIVKLDTTDIGELLAVLERRQDAVGYTGKGLFHETPGGGNKVISFSRGENGGFYLKVSAQDENKNKIGPYAQNLSDGEGAVLATLLRETIVKMTGWHINYEEMKKD